MVTTTGLDIQQVNEIIEAEPTHMFQLDELAKTNLLNLHLPRRGSKEYPLLVQHSTDKSTFFKLFYDQWHDSISANLRPAQMTEIESLLQQTTYTYTVRYYGPNYFKDSHGQRCVGLELSSHYFPQSTRIYLRDFGHSYGKVEINGFLCDISHSGGTGNDEEGKPIWVDFAHGFQLVGHKNVIPALKSLIVPPGQNA